MVVGMPDIVPRSAARRREVDCVGPLVPELRSDPLDRAFFVSLGETSSSTSASEWPDTIEEGRLCIKDWGHASDEPACPR